MKYISLNWTLALKLSIGKKERMRDCRILMTHDCMWENYKTHRDDRPLIRKEILWSVLRAVLKTSPRVKSYDLLHICT